MVCLFFADQLPSPFCSSAVDISKLVRGKHTVAIAKSMVGSVKKIDIKFRILCQAITKTGHLITMEPRGFSKTLKPMLTFLAPLMNQDTSFTWNLEDPEFLASLNCETAFFETARLLVLENQGAGT